MACLRASRRPSEEWLQWKAARNTQAERLLGTPAFRTAWACNNVSATACGRSIISHSLTSVSLGVGPFRRDVVRGLAKAKAPAAELTAACAGVPDEAAAKAGSNGRPAEMLAAFVAFRDEVAALAAAGAPAGEVLAACDR